MRCTIYDWMSQSDQHLAFARQHYPMAAEVHDRTMDRVQFLQVVRSMDLSHRRVIKAERDAWFKAYGYAWKRLGCPRETWMNQRSFLMTAPVMGATSVFDEDWGDEWIDDVTGTADGDLPPMVESYPDDPSMPTGYARCYNPMVQGMPVTVDVPTNQPGWRVDHYVGADDRLYYFYHSTWGDSFWACPKPSSASTHSKEEVKQIQRALSKRGYNPGPIDGAWGPKTCSAMYAYSYEHKGFADPTLDEDLFGSLDLGGRGFAERYGRSCDAWFTGELGGAPIPEEDVVVTMPVEPTPQPTTVLGPEGLKIANEKKAGFGLVVGIIMVGGLVGTVWAVSRDKKKKR